MTVEVTVALLLLQGNFVKFVDIGFAWWFDMFIHNIRSVCLSLYHYFIINIYSVTRLYSRYRVDRVESAENFKIQLTYNNLLAHTGLHYFLLHGTSKALHYAVSHKICLTFFNDLASMFLKN